MGTKFFASFLLGAAAGFAAAKYMSMTDEEKERLKNKVKDKANAFKSEAENAANKARDYFGKAEQTITDVFKKKPATE